MSAILDFQASLLFHLRNNVYPPLPIPDSYLDLAIEVIAAGKDGEWDKEWEGTYWIDGTSMTTRQIAERLSLMGIIQTEDNNG